MLDANLIKFVEPIGPGQIVDRESLVALPIGFIRVSIENNHSELVVKILGIQGMSSMDDNVLSQNTIIRTYIWQNGVVIAGEDLVEEQEERVLMRRNSRLTSMRRRRPIVLGNSFRFEKMPKNSEKHSRVVDGILQICAYKPSSGKIQRKTFLGTVHIALKCLTSDQFQSSNDSLPDKKDWYKVFPKSAFLPGSPSDIAKTNCYISEQNMAEENEILLDAEDSEVASTSSSCCSNGKGSVVSFSQFNLQHSRRPSLFTSPGLLRAGVKPPHDHQVNRSASRNSIVKWMRRQMSLEENRSHPRVINRLASISEPTELSNAAPSSAPFLVGSPTSTLSRSSLRSSFQSSCSTYSSSTDIGYESSGSNCSSTSGDSNASSKGSMGIKFRSAISKLGKRTGKQGKLTQSTPPINIPVTSTARIENANEKRVRYSKRRDQRSSRGISSISEIRNGESINSFEMVALKQ